MLVLEAVEQTRLYEAAPRFIRVVYGGELEKMKTWFGSSTLRKSRCTFGFSRASGRS